MGDPGYLFSWGEALVVGFLALCFVTAFLDELEGRE